MKVLLLGSNGMLGQMIKRQLIVDGVDLYCVDKFEADYCFDLLNDKILEKCFNDVYPDIVINTAAIVNLEECEVDPGRAYCLNARLPGILGSLCNEYKAYYVHISTDHYYCGDNNKIHKESDPVRLLNEYARTKYIGEQMALLYRNVLVLRTNIVGFRGRGNQTFIEWVISEYQNHKKMTLYTDFFTSSIHTADFARILSDLLKLRPTGIYNLASSEVFSKKEFILALISILYDCEPLYVVGSVNNMNAIRRGNSLGLDTTKIETLLGYRMPSLSETLLSIKREYLEREARNVL